MPIEKNAQKVSINGIALEGVWIDEIKLKNSNEEYSFKSFPKEATLTLDKAEIHPEFQKWLKEEQVKHENKIKLIKMAHHNWMKGQGLL